MKIALVLAAGLALWTAHVTRAPCWRYHEEVTSARLNTICRTTYWRPGMILTSADLAAHCGVHGVPDGTILTPRLMGAIMAAHHVQCWQISGAHRVRP